MNHAAVIIEPETPADVQPMDHLLRAVFPEPAEAELVRTLRAAGDVQLSLVARITDELVGAVIFSRVELHTPTGVVAGTILAPVAVAAAHQRCGIGSRLIRHGLQSLEQSGWAFAVVLGETEFYGRFGFNTEAATRIVSPWNGPYWQAIIWQRDAMPRVSTNLSFPSAFAALG
ncbi:MAG: hypothetical protein B7Z55_02660 [Planctomycetales bacterium 12-60-4]|nr:MAG: hypothetical protein B7Z55_02660 [Planctomycetales bacterium 12-60-4]